MRYPRKLVSLKAYFISFHVKEKTSDLMAFKNKVSPSRHTISGTHFFELNGRADFGSAYQRPTATMNAINNGHMFVFDLEVYSVKGIYLLTYCFG